MIDASLALSKLNVLVLDTNIEEFTLLEAYLKEKIEQLVLYRARSFADASEVITNLFELDVILFRINLPDESTYEQLKEIVKFKRQLPIIAILGELSEDYGAHTISLGITDYVMKAELNADNLHGIIVKSIARKRLERVLKESENNYQNFFHKSPLPMWIYDINTLNFLSVNEAAEKQYGYSREEFLGMSMKNIRPPEEVKSMEERIKANGYSDVLYKESFPHQKKNGSIMMMEIQSKVIVFEGIKAKLLLASDVSEKIKSEEALKLSEQRFKVLVQEGADLIGILDFEGNQKYVSPNLEAILGIDSEHYLGKNFFDMIHVNDQKRVKEQFQLLYTQKRLLIAPFRVVLNGHSLRWIETIFTNMMDDLSIGGIVANSRDVTASIEYENKLNESVDRYNIVAKATSDTIWDRDLTTEKIIWNKGLQGIFGYREVITSVDWWYSKVHPEDIGRITGLINHHVNKKNPRWQVEYRFQCNDGTYKYVFDRVFLVIDEFDKAIRMIGAMQDITRQKEEERRLKLLESVITNTNDSIVIIEAESYDTEGPKIVFVNDAFTKMTGYSKEEVIGRTPDFLYGPNSDKKELLRLKNTMDKWEACDIEIINYKKNGDEFWINIEIAPVSDGKGWYTHWIAIERDISERMNYIKAIEKQNIKLRDIAWMQSHQVRAPLARIMGFIELLNNKGVEDKSNLIKYMQSSANELDQIIRTIVKKTEQVENPRSQ